MGAENLFKFLHLNKGNYSWCQDYLQQMEALQAIEAD
jgi:hypothetical protein